MKLTAIGRTLGYETTPYSVTDYKAKTVVEFVNEVLERTREWGYINVNELGSIEYRKGELLNPIPDTWQYKMIDKIESVGGWTRMDYYITTK